MSARFSPYRVWFVTTIIVRLSQLIVVTAFVWALAVLIDAANPPSDLSLPPFWPVFIAILLGASGGVGAGTWQRRTVSGWIADRLAPQWCPICGQDIFDPTPPHGYHPPQDREAFFPSKTCSNCGFDLTKRIAR